MSEALFGALIGSISSLLGVFLAFILQYFIKDWLDNKKKRKLIMKTALIEAENNYSLLLGYQPRDYLFFDDVLKNAVVSGEIEVIDEDLKDLLMELRGLIGLFNSTVNTSRGVSTRVTSQLNNILPRVISNLKKKLGIKILSN